ncbi:formylglycine-generating enzyme family protein [Nitrospira sp. Ecomares 2.1]
MKSDRRLKKEGGPKPSHPFIPLGAAAFAIILGLGIWWYSTAQSDRSSVPNQQVGITCDMGITAAKSGRVPATPSAPPLTSVNTSVPSANASSGSAHSSPPSDPAPDGMVWIPGGEFSMGAADSSDNEMNDVGMQATRDSRPIHPVYVDGFWMDKTEVTNAQFTLFVDATGYVTVAERTPRAEDFPGAPTENLVAGSVVFSPPDHSVPLDTHFRWWSYIKGANWRHPLGPTSDLNGREEYPVVHIAYEDAEAYAKWAGKRLPTEAEWEFAARGGLSGKVYPWGDEFRKDGQWMANSFQGQFPQQDTGDDRYTGIGPVAKFPPNGYGLYDVAGNVWEWTSDWYRPDYYARLTIAGGVAHNPQGPDSPFDPTEPGEKKRVHRGGSFLCTEQYCSRYMVGTRGKGEINTGTSHLGFRTVRSQKSKSG